MGRAIHPRDQVGEQLVGHADQQQRQQRHPRVGQAVAGERRGLVHQLGAIAFARGQRDWFYADGIHTKGAGSDQYAALIKKTMSS